MLSMDHVDDPFHEFDESMIMVVIHCVIADPSKQEEVTAAYRRIFKERAARPDLVAVVVDVDLFGSVDAWPDIWTKALWVQEDGGNA